MRYGGDAIGTYGGFPAGINQASVAITGGTIGGASINNGLAGVLVAKGSVPFINAPTGTMGNNGAITLGTALDRIYANAYIWLPAGAIAAGVPAAPAAYFVQMSSTTVGTVFNNLLTANLATDGSPLVPASPTAFATTGPGAFTGVTGAVTPYTATVAANAMGANGQVTATFEVIWNNTAGNKTWSMVFGGSSLLSQTGTTSVGGIQTFTTANAGVTNKQNSNAQNTLSASISNMLSILTSIDTTASVAITDTLNKGTATDWMILTQYRVVLYANGI